jgi:ElaB/YqjD/DUF883 family membrane-anchored ribosome-binding protein
MTRRSDQIHEAEGEVARMQVALDETQRALEKADETDQAVTAAASSPLTWIAVACVVGLILGMILLRRKSR